jgi:hypothetical protein
MLVAFSLVEILILCNLVNFLPTSDKGVQNRAGVLFLLSIGQYSVSGASLALSCNIYIVPIEKRVFFKEEASGFYGVSAYWIARNIALLPQQIFFPLLGGSISYWIIGFNPQFHKFVIYCNIYTVILMIISNITGGGIGLLAGTIFTDHLSAMHANGIVSAFLSLYAGMFVSSDSILSPFNLVQYISVRYM